MFVDVVTDVTLFDVIAIGLSIGHIDGGWDDVDVVVVVATAAVDVVTICCDNCWGVGRGRIDAGCCWSVFEFI